MAVVTGAQLREELERIPAQRGVSLRVVRLVDDPCAGAADVASALGLDPALTVRVLQVANSAYYGLSGRIRSTSFAVTVVGFQTIRSLAVLAAAGVTREGALPAGFWRRSAAVATGAALMAERAGAPAPEAFCTGMLHDLGTVLLWRRDPEGHEALQRRVSDELPLSLLEQQAYGGTHATLCGEVLAAWHVPDDLCRAIGRHHDQPSVGAAPLRKALQAGIALGSLLEGGREDTFTRLALDAVSVPPSQLASLLDRVRLERDQLAAILAG